MSMNIVGVPYSDVHLNTYTMFHNIRIFSIFNVINSFATKLEMWGNWLSLAGSLPGLAVSPPSE